MPAQQRLASLHHAGTAVTDRLVIQFELLHGGCGQRQPEVVFQPLLVTLARQHAEIEQVPARPAALLQREQGNLHAALQLFHATAMLGIQGRADTEHGHQRTPAQFIRRAQGFQQLGRHLGRARFIHVGCAYGERIRPGARHHAAHGSADQAQAVGHLHQQGLIFARAQHGADLGVLFEAHQEECAAARAALGIVEPSAGAPVQFLMIQDTGQFIARQPLTQQALPAHEDPAYRYKCARKRQAQCEQVTLTHEAPYP